MIQAALRQFGKEVASMAYKAIGAAVITEVTSILHHIWFG